jgi:hypothetical protein
MPAAPAHGGSASKPSLARVLPMRGSKSARTVSRPPARCVGRTQMWRSDIPSTTVTPSEPQRSLPRMGTSSLRAQELQLMRSPGEPLQLNQRSFGCLIGLAVIGHRPRARSSSDASRGSVEITVLPRTSRRQLSPVSAPLRHCYCAGHFVVSHEFRIRLPATKPLSPGQGIWTCLIDHHVDRWPISGRSAFDPTKPSRTMAADPESSHSRRRPVVGCAHLGHPVDHRSGGWLAGGAVFVPLAKNATQQLRSVFPRAIRSCG